MKLFRTSLLLAAALGVAALLPSCGGGADESGNQFVSVSAFKSGSCGFYIHGSPDIRIVSSGMPNDVNPGSNPFPQIGRPDSSISESVEDEWMDFAGDLADVGNGTSSCLVNVVIRNSQEQDYSISGTATYVVSDRMGYLELNFNEISGGSGNLEYAALIHFMGAVTKSDLTYTSEDNSIDSTGVSSGSAERILITTLTGSTMKFWFNFDTNQVLTELCYVCQLNVYYEDGAGNAHEAVTPVTQRGVWRIVHPFLRLN